MKSVPQLQVVSFGIPMQINRIITKSQYLMFMRFNIILHRQFVT